VVQTGISQRKEIRPTSRTIPLPNKRTSPAGTFFAKLARRPRVSQYCHHHETPFEASATRNLFRMQTNSVTLSAMSSQPSANSAIVLRPARANLKARHETTRKFFVQLRRDVLNYYKGDSAVDESLQSGHVWCHISGCYRLANSVKAARIVPFFVDMNLTRNTFLRSQGESEDGSQASNTLLLTGLIKKWFNSYHLAIVPIDAKETPTKRWRTDVISTEGADAGCYDDDGRTLQDLDGKELTFLNEKRPDPRFLYLRFIVALFEIRSLGRPGWQFVWGRYSKERPFPTPSPEMRNSMRCALNDHLGPDDTCAMEAWMGDTFTAAPYWLRS